MLGRDQTDVLLETVADARAAGHGLAIVGTGSKSFISGAGDSDASAEAEASGRADEEVRLLSTAEHQGIVDYRPDELMVTVRSGTPLRELRAELARHGQMLPFEPPEYLGLGTAGGAVAAGLAGPGRPWWGGARDALLGVVMINGLAERVSFGGQVMKNVAGFDVSRLQAGAFGMLGLLLELSFRLLPQPALVETRVLELEGDEALGRMREWARQPGAVSATTLEDGALHVRLSGTEAAVLDTAARLGGEVLKDDGYWGAVRDQRRPSFRRGPLGVRHVLPGTAVDARDLVIEWAGARRWQQIDDGVAANVLPFGSGYARRVCMDAGGNALQSAYQRRLKAAFDPDNLFNPWLCDADVPA